MFKRLFCSIILIFSVTTFASAQEIPVQLETLSKISTSNVNMHEGDNISLTVTKDVYVNSKLYIKKGTNATGVITNLVDNGFTCQEASIYAENFRIKTVDGKVIKLKGIVFKKGRNHWMFTQFLPIGYQLIRGGESEILPQKDVFTLYLETNDD